MRLRITTPLTIAVDEDVVQIVTAEDASGGFGIQPHHADFLTSLTVGVVSWKDSAGARHYCAVHGGVMTVSGGQEVSISTREAIPGEDLATLDQAILDRFGADDAAERTSRVDSTKLQLRAIREMVRHLQPGALS
jgi:F-type H+-transporting ATPase subunit epsilon